MFSERRGLLWAGGADCVHRSLGVGGRAAAEETKMAAVRLPPSERTKRVNEDGFFLGR